MSRVSYADAGRLAGHEPVKEREDHGLTLKARYDENDEGLFDLTPKRVLARRNDDEEAFS